MLTRAMIYRKEYVQNIESDMCCYCAVAVGTTRDHVPSKILLDKPYPENLMTVPCCEKCNNSFSADEEYVAALIEKSWNGCLDDDFIERDAVRKSLRHSESIRARLDNLFSKDDNGILFLNFEESRLINVMGKTALGLARYECGKIFTLKKVVPFLRDNLTAEALELFESRMLCHEQFPEVGSRLLSQIVESGNVMAARWKEVQPNRFRYMIRQRRNGVEVRLVFSECFVAVVDLI